MIEELNQILAPPASRAFPVPSWDEVEDDLGSKLPSDFKQIVDSYGSGSIDDFLWILNPASGNRNVSFLASEGIRRAYLEIKKQFPQQYPRDVFPSRGGILPWAITDNGDSFFWITEGPVDSWKVGVHDKTQSVELTFDLGAGEFLIELLARRLPCDLLPESFLGNPSHTFIPLRT